MNFDYDTYSSQMRKDLSNKNIITEDGNINHPYFLAKKGSYWSADNENSLKRGIQLFGVGKWKKIKYYENLKDFSELEIELRTCMLLGVTDINQYRNCKLGDEEIENERSKNVSKAKSSKKSKGGLFLVGN